MDISHELTRLLNTKETEINVKADIEERQNNFIANVIIEEFVKLKDIIDPKEELNAKTLAKKCFDFIMVELRSHMRHIHFGMGSYSSGDVKKFQIYRLGWIGAGKHGVKATEKGYKIASDFF